jgi:hypothetical protein
MKLNLRKTSVTNLLKLYSEILKELRQRTVVRSSNNPAGDYTEWLVSEKLNLIRNGNSTAGFDATDKKGRRYQIKGRRLTLENSSTELSAIRNLKKKPFDFLVAVVYEPDFRVDYAAKVPFEVVRKHAKYSMHVNGWRFLMVRSILKKPGVVDVTKRLRA